MSVTRRVLILIAVTGLLTLAFVAQSPAAASTGPASGVGSHDQYKAATEPGIGVQAAEFPIRGQRLPGRDPFRLIGGQASGNGAADVRAAGSGSVSGTVKTAGGTALAGVEVDIYDQQFNLVGQTTTNSTGDYSVSYLPDTTVCVGTFNLLGYVDQWYNNVILPGNWDATGATWLDLVATPTRPGINFGLSLGRSISGKVTNTSSTALSGVAVEAYGPDGYVWSYGMTSSTGVYTIGGLLSGQYHVATLNGDNYIDQWYSGVTYAGNFDGTGSTPLTISSANLTGINFKLALGHYITGSTNSNGQSVSGVHVEAYDLSGNLMLATVSQGTYGIGGLPAGEYRVRTRDPYHQYVDVWYSGTPVVSSPDGSNSTSIDLRSITGISSVSFGMYRAGQMGGTVTDAMGDPLAGVRVYARYYTDTGYRTAQTYVVTDALGKWTYPGLPTFGTYTVHTSNDQGYIDEYSDGELYPGNLDATGIPHVSLASTWPTIDFSLGHGYTISGHITDNVTGQALTGPDMAIEIMDKDGAIFAGNWVGGGVAADYTTWALPPGTYYAKTTDYLGGSYVEEWFSNLPCGQYDLAAATPIVVGSSDVANIDFGLDRMNHYEQNDSHIGYAGTWSTYTNTAASGGSYTASNTAGSCATVAFNGTRLDLTSVKSFSAPMTEYAEVYLDGVDKGWIDMVSNTNTYSMKVWTTGVLTKGIHVVRFEWHKDNLGSPNAYTSIDAFDVAGTLVTAPPAVMSMSPVSGPPAGGTTVTINGSGFAGLSGAGAVTFGGVNAASYTVNSATKITAVSPPHAIGTVDVVVTGSAGKGAVAPADRFSYVNRYEQNDAGIDKAGTWSDVTSTSASAGNYGRSNSGTADVNIWFTGTKFSLIATKGSTASGVDVYIDGTYISGYELNASATQYQVPVWTSDDLPYGTHHTELMRWTETASEYMTFDAVDVWGTIVAPLPSITSLSPTSGWSIGGDTVYITGHSFTGATAVTFGGVGATHFTVDSATQITAVTPPHAGGAVQVQVTTPSGSTQDTYTDDFTYVVPGAPTIAGLLPTSGSVGGGTSVQIYGSNFVGLSGPSAVTFGGVNAASYTVQSATQIVAVAPPHAEGTVQVQVTAYGGSTPDQPWDDFTYTTVTRYDMPISSFARTGTWADYASSSSYMHGYARSNTAGASATIWFNGTRLDYIAMKGTTTGKADIYVDGAKVTSTPVSLANSGGALYQQNVWSTGELPSGLHSVKIVRSSTSASGKYLTLDAVDIYGTIAAAPTRYEQTDTHIVRSGTWTNYSNSTASGSSYGRSSTGSASATIHFTGSRIDYIGFKGTTTGIVDIYLDGDLEATIDLTATTAAGNLLIWSSGSISNAAHTLLLVRNSGSTASEFLTLDAVDIWGAITS